MKTTALEVENDKPNNTAAPPNSGPFHGLIAPHSNHASWPPVTIGTCVLQRPEALNEIRAPIAAWKL